MHEHYLQSDNCSRFSQATVEKVYTTVIQVKVQSSNLKNIDTYRLLHGFNKVKSFSIGLYKC